MLPHVYFQKTGKYPYFDPAVSTDGESVQSKGYAIHFLHR